MCCEYGYTRKSTPKQSIDRQIRNIKSFFPNAIILQETYTGTKIDRKEWNKLYRVVKAGDIDKFTFKEITTLFSLLKLDDETKLKLMAA